MSALVPLSLVAEVKLHTSQSTKPPLLWSTMAGVRPLGLRSVYGFFLTENMSKRMMLYSMPSSSSTMATFHGFGELGNASHVRLNLELWKGRSSYRLSRDLLVYSFCHSCTFLLSLVFFTAEYALFKAKGGKTCGADQLIGVRGWAPQNSV